MKIILIAFLIFVIYMTASFVWYVVQDDETHDHDPSRFDGTIQDFFNERL